MVLGVGGAFAQEVPEPGGLPETVNTPSFSLGDQIFGISAGGYFPLLLINPNTGTQGSPNQDIGGQVALQWNIYLNSFLSVGVETAYIFSNTPNDRTLSVWPIAIQISFAPRIGPFLIPIHFDVGIILDFYQGATQPSLLLRGGVGVYWFFDPSWAVGLDAEYYFVPQLFAGSEPPSTENRLLNSVVASVGVIYRL